MAYTRAHVHATIQPTNQALEVINHKKPTYRLTDSPSFIIHSDGLVAQNTHKAETSTLHADTGSITAKVLEANGNPTDIHPTIESSDDDPTQFVIRVSSNERQRTNAFLLSVELTNETKTQTITQDFTWGVLALNFDQSSYTIDEKVNVGMAVLDDKGRTLCDAKVNVDIRNPDGQTKSFSTQAKTVAISKECQDKSVTNLADYFLVYAPDRFGTYTVNFTAETANGTNTLTDVFEVTDQADYVIKRHNIPTRIYPPSSYQAELTIVANKPITGTFKEVVPQDFVVTQISNEGRLAKDENSQTVTWPVTLKKDTSTMISYSFKAPNVSPAFYLLGPAQISRSTLDETNGIVSLSPQFTEPRAWQIAADETGSTSFLRRWSGGFELNSATAGVEYTSNVGTPTINSNGSFVRSGSYSFHTNPSATTSGLEFDTETADTATGFYYRAYIYIATAPASTISIMEAYDLGNTVQTSLQLKSDRTLQLCNIEDDASCASPVLTWSTAIPLNTWTRLEMKEDSTTIASTKVNAKVNGVAFGADGTVDHANGVMTFRLGVLSGTTSPDIYWDDVAVNNINNASSPNATDGNWPGEGKIVHLHPNGGVGTSHWLNGAGTTCVTGGTNCYDMVNEVTPDDGASNDYIKAPATCSTTSTEDFAMDDSATAGIGSSDRIRLVQANLRLDKAGSQANSALIMTALDGANTNSSGNIDMTNAVYKTNNATTTTMGSVFSLHDLPGSTTTPSTVYPYTSTTLDSLQFRIAPSGTDCSPLQQVATIWATVEYVPASGGRLWTSGLELNSTTAAMEYTANVGSPTVQSTTKRSGAYALQTNPSSATQGISYDFETADTQAGYYLRAYLNITTAPSVTTKIMVFRDNAATDQLSLRLTNGRALQLWNEEDNAQVGSDSSALSTGTWYRLELKIDTTTLASTGADARIDGVSFASGTVNHANGVRTLQLGVITTATTANLFFDDVALNKNFGTTQNSWPGSGKVAHLHPNADGDQLTWTNTYTNIDEVPPNDATDLISSTTLGQVEDANLEATSVPGITANDTINLVSVGVRFNSSSTNVSAFKVRLKDAANAAPLESDQILANSTTWKTNVDTGPLKYPLTAYTRPDITSTWTASDLDNTQIGVRETTDTADTQQVTNLWLLVEYRLPTISGTVYSNEGSTAIGNPPCDGTTAAVRVRVNGTSQNLTTQCALADSTYSLEFTSDPATSDIITVYLDNVTANATSVTRFQATSSLTGMDLYQDRVIVRNEDGTALSNTNLDQWDSGNEGDGVDGDIGFTVTSGALTVSNTRELHIWTGKTFTPGGSVATNSTSTQSGAGGDLHIHTSATLSMGTNALSVGGDYNNGGTFSKSSGQTTAFTATGANFTITPGTGNFDSVTFNGASGDWTPQAATTLDADLTMTNGTLKGTQDVTVKGAVAGTSGVINLTGGNFNQNVAASKIFGTTTGSTAWTFNDLTFSDSTTNDVTITTQTGGSGDVTVSGVLAIGKVGDSNITTLDAGNRIWILTGSSTPLSITAKGAFTANASTVNYTGGADAGSVTLATATYNSLGVGTTANANAVTYNTSGNTTIDTLLTVGNASSTAGKNDTLGAGNFNLTIKDITITTRGIVTAPGSSKAFNLSGNWTNNAGASGFTHNSGTLTVAPASTSTFTGATTFNNFTSTTAGKTIQFQAHSGGSPVFTFAGTFTITGGSDPNQINLQSDSSGTQWEAHFNSAQSGTVTNTKIKDSGCDTGTNTNTLDATDTDVSGNDTSCWIFPGGTPTFEQSAYRFGGNQDSVSISYSGAPSANSALTVTSTGQKFRLRLLLHVGTANLATNGQDFKLRFGEKPSAGCASATYSDVATGSGVIRYYNNTTPADGDNLISVVGDPTHSSDTVVNQDYEEANNFTNSVGAINSGQDGMWDFALENNSAFGGKRYCFKVTKSDGTDLTTYTNYPEVIIDEELTFALDASSKDFGTITPGASASDTTSTLTTTTNASVGYQVTLWATQLLTSGSNTIDNWTGTNTSPTTLSGTGTSAFGYSTNDSTLGGGTADRFTSSANLFAGFATTGPGDIVADNIATPVTGDAYTVTYRLRTAGTQAHGRYTTTLIYINTANY